MLFCSHVVLRGNYFYGIKQSVLNIKMDIEMQPVRYHMGEFPPKKIDFERLSTITGESCIELGRYDRLLSAIPNAHLLLSPLMTQEAVLSSKIEGTRVAMSEVLEIEAGGLPFGISQSKKDDTHEIINYRYALQSCADEIKLRSISQKMLRQAHEILLRGVRGKDKSPGKYRTKQNWIGEPECPIESAGFIPIPPEQLSAGMDLWSSYVNSDININPVAKLAIIHVEFEALHPFNDGNGRVGRMLIPLFLHQIKILNSPSFYMSSYFDKNRIIYQSKLRAVSERNEWTEWIEFFSIGVKEEAINNTKKQGQF
jgi:Fic family protein